MKPLYKRSFLNGDKGVGAITIALSKEKETEYIGTVEISDCNRLVRLDFDFWTPKMKRQKLAKLNKLIAMLTELRDAIVPAEIKKF